MSEQQKKVKHESMTFRVDKETKAAIEKVASENSRTAAGQVIHFCKQGLAKYEQEKQGS